MARKASSPLEEALVLLEILKRIPRSSDVSVNDLLNSLNDSGYQISRRTLQRYLKGLSEREGFGVIRNDKSKPYGYRRKVNEGGFSITKLTPNESLLLRLAQEHMARFIPSRLVSDLSFLFEEAKRTLNEQSASEKERQWLSKVGVVNATMPQIPPVVLPRVFSAVSDGLYRNLKIEVDYEKINGEKIKATVAPLALIQQDVRLYLVCQFDGYPNFRHLALNRIKRANLTSFSFERPKNFNLASYTSGRHLNFSNGGLKRLVMEFANPDTEKVLKEAPFSKDQKIEKIGENLWRLTATIVDSNLVDGWYGAWKELAKISRFERLPLESNVI